MKQETLEEAAEIDLTNLCHYDKRNPDCSVDDEDIEDYKKFLLKRNRTCNCDNCFYRRTELTEQLIRQQERMYSEEEVYNLLETSIKDCHLWELEEHHSGNYKNLTEWFEQFKKK